MEPTSWIEQIAAQEPESGEGAKALGTWDMLEPYLSMIPAEEADCVTMYFHDRVRQQAIADAMIVSQPTISNRIRRAIRRIQFLRALPVLEKDRFFLDMSGFDHPDVIWTLWKTTCQSDTAIVHGLKRQQDVRRIFMSARQFWERNGLVLYQDAFEMLSHHWCIKKHLACGISSNRKRLLRLEQTRACRAMPPNSPSGPAPGT